MNPDGPPTDVAESEAADVTLHPIKGILVAAFLGTFVGAGVVMAINYARIGKKTAAYATALASVVATVAVLAVIFALPEDLPIPNLVFIVPQLLLVYLVAKKLQGQIVEDHADRGGSVASQWPSAGIGLLCLVVVAVGVFATVFLLEESYGQAIAFGNDEVYIAGEATEADAGRLAQALQDAEFFGSAGASVRLEVLAGQTTVSFVVVDDAWNDPEMVQAFTDLGRILVVSEIGKPLTVELCDAYFDVQKTMVIE